MIILESFDPARVWLKDKNVPGLAMSRSLGYKIAASVEVISKPEISVWNIKESDKFIIACSDGIFEVLGNEKAVRIVEMCWKEGNPGKAVDQLFETARAVWTRCGDKWMIVVVLLFLNKKSRLTF